MVLVTILAANNKSFAFVVVTAGVELVAIVPVPTVVTSIGLLGSAP